jgi:hypothetical protein
MLGNFVDGSEFDEFHPRFDRMNIHVVTPIVSTGNPSVDAMVSIKNPLHPSELSKDDWTVEVVTFCPGVPA